MSKVLEPLAKVGSIGLDHVTDTFEHVTETLDHVTDKFDPKAVVEKLDPRAVAEKLAPRPLVEPLVGKLEQLDPRTSRRRPPKRRGRKVTLVLVLVGLGGAAFFVLRKRRQPTSSVTPGRDTATGTDPNAKYDRPGYEDKSLGQAVNSDMDLVDELVDQEHGDMSRAEQRFEQESAGAPARQRQARGA